MTSFLEFEKSVAALHARIAQLQDTTTDDPLDSLADIEKLQTKADRLLRLIYANLTPWQKTQVARHPERPHFRDYIDLMFTDFMPLSGDRAFADDAAIIGGFAKLNGLKVMVIGHEKGRDTQSRLKHNFGMGRPEGYRKAIRLMDLAERFGLPVVTLVDTSGAFPGIDAEERGQAEAIARATERCLTLNVPMIACIVGEGGSGGAVALASAERVLMLEHAVYSVISPEGCASILWRTAEKADEAAEAMRITAQHLIQLGVIDRIVKEPKGGAHRDPAMTCAELSQAVSEELDVLLALTPAELQEKRYQKYLTIGQSL
ncbi:acetyl-CoA carboxylase carboxyltransferase subunit alpha [Parasphingorhabdus sp. DH2-15]|uniref:acetyl-CoA carboxylase carboxyltransferase subunit alpha n=1 Tax=Parasphingorhabdus sp. DH2-15 TaxID=3444112 RepID=UPI003F6875FE